MSAPAVVPETVWAADKDLQQEVAAQEAQRKAGRTTFYLSFLCLGIVYGDIGTSPLYVYSSSFSRAPTHEEVYGVASVIFWLLTLIVLFKYVMIVMSADHDGEGGTFALYALLCRTMHISPNDALKQAPEEHVEVLARTVSSDLRWKCGLPKYLHGLRTPRVAAAISRTFRQSNTLQFLLLAVSVVATGMVIGDSIITPSISVLSAVGGLVNIPTHAVQEEGILTQPKIAGISISILAILFAFQYHGTRRISVSFAPIVAVWLLFNFAIGWYNMATYGFGIWKVLSPSYIYYYFVNDGRNGAHAWATLSGIMLCITGTEALFADLGHFNQASIMLSFTFFVYPCLVVTYLGQAAFLAADASKYPMNAAMYANTFWASLPPGEGVLYAMIVVATLAAIVSSQAMISGCFSIIRQAINLGVFPKLKIRHSNDKLEGQIYIGAVNWGLMILCIAITAGFGVNSPIVGQPRELANAYGVSVMFVMWFTTILITLVILVVWELHPLVALAFFLPVFALETVLLSANLFKVPTGGWFTLMIAAVIVIINFTWWAGTRVKANNHNKLTMSVTDYLRTVPDYGRTSTSGAVGSAGKGRDGPQLVFADDGAKITTSSPAMGIYFHDSEFSGAMPSVMQAMLSHTHSIHAVSLLVTVRVLPLPRVPPNASMLVRPVPGMPRMFQVVVRTGFHDTVTMNCGSLARIVSKINRMLVAASSPMPPIAPAPPAPSPPEHAESVPTSSKGSDQRLASAAPKTARLSLTFARGSDVEMCKPSLAKAGSVRFTTAWNGNLVMQVDDSTGAATQYRLEPAAAAAASKAVMDSMKAGVVYYIGCNATRVLPRANPIVDAAVNTFFEFYTFLERNSYADYLAWDIPQEALVEVRTPTPV